MQEIFHRKQLKDVFTDTLEVKKDSLIFYHAKRAYIAILNRPDYTVGFSILAQRQNPTKKDVIQVKK